MSTITVDVPEGFKEALLKNSYQFADHCAKSDVEKMVQIARVKLAKEALEDFEDKKCVYESAEQALYAAKWKAEELIRKVMP